jgi:hypothetical protein
MAGQPWFVRRRRAGQYTINPVSRGGWMLLLGYAVALLAITPLLLLGMPVGALNFAAVAVLLSIAFAVIAWRTSVPEGEWRG